MKQKKVKIYCLDCKKEVPINNSWTWIDGDEIKVYGNCNKCGEELCRVYSC